MNNNLIKDSRNLSILVSRYGLSFLLKDKKQTGTKFFEYFFEKTNPFEIENNFKQILKERPVLTHTFEQVEIIHHNHLNTLVPKEFFNPNYPEKFLKFNNKILDFDKAHFDEIAIHQINNVYIPFSNINNLLLDYNEEVNFFHSSTRLINKIDRFRENKEVLSLYDVYLNIFHRDFQLLIYKNEEIIYFNSFDFSTNDDFLYFFFFVLETLKIPNKPTDFQICGVNDKFAVMKDLNDFVEKWKFLPIENPGTLNNFIP